MKSSQIQTLYTGMNVHVAEIIGRRARIIDPYEGWVSIKSSIDILILKSLAPKVINCSKLKSILQSTE